MDEKKTFFTNVKSEFGKIAWLSKEKTLKHTIAVIIAAGITGVVIALVDFGVQHGLDLLMSIGG